MGRKGGAIPGRVRRHVRRILAGGATLRLPSAGQVGGHPETVAGHRGTLGGPQIPIRRHQQSHHGRHGRHQAHHGVQEAPGAVHLRRPAATIRRQNPHPHRRLLDHQEHRRLRCSAH